MSGMVSENVLNNLVTPAFMEDLPGAMIIDVRNDVERAKVPALDNAINIPLETLRERINEIPKDKKVVLHCTKGFKSYIACRILSAHGYTNAMSFCGGALHFHELKLNWEHEDGDVA